MRPPGGTGAAICLLAGLLVLPVHAGDPAAWLTQTRAIAGNVTASNNGGSGWTLDGTGGVAYDYGALDALNGKPVDGSTIEFLFNLADAGTTTIIGSFLSWSPGNEWQYIKLEQWSNTGKFGLTTPGAWDKTFAMDSLFDQDVHLVLRRNNDSGTLDLFINGVFAETESTKTNWRQDGGNGYIGSDNDGDGDNATGTVYGVASYDEALSDQEIAALYSAFDGPRSEPHAVVTPAALDYGNYDSASGPQDMSFAIANFGASQPLEIRSIQFTGPDAALFTAGSFPASIAPQATADVTVTFAPGNTSGTVSATLEIETNGGNQAMFDLPLSAFAFEPLPGKAAVLIAVPHPDDEGLFYGGTMTYYSKIRNLPTVILAMTSGDSGIGSQPPENRFLREDEFRNAARVYGMRYEPIFARFDDGGSSVETVETWTQFPNTGDDAADYLAPFTGNPVEYAARWIRILRPEVLVTSDEGGDYGHGDHRHTSAAVVAAYGMAADADVTILDDEGTPLAPWAATKLYVHDAGFDDPGHLGHLFHDHWEIAYDELGGLTPRIVAGLGLEEHVSQAVPRESRSYYGDPYWGAQYEPSELWTMLASTVGLDTFNVGELSDDPDFDNHPDIRHGDFFENIDLDPFAGYLADANGDGGVDGNDLAILLGNLGENVAFGSVASGDASGDGHVNQADLDLLHLANPDTDSDGLPDAWELAHFSGLPVAAPGIDTDGDGLDNLDEFVAGRDPNLPDRIDFGINSATRSIDYSVPVASGPGYRGLTRRYQLWFSPDLSDWTTMVADGIGDGTSLSYPIPPDLDQRYYRLGISIGQAD